MISIRNIFVLLSFLAANFGFSQAAPVQMVSVKLRALVASGGAVSFFYKTGTGVVELKSGADFFLPTCDYVGSARLNFYASKLIDEKSVPVASVVLPGGVEEVLLLIIRKEDGIRVIPLDFSPNALSQGDYLVYNLTTRPLGVSYMNMEIQVPSGGFNRMKGVSKTEAYGAFRIFANASGDLLKVFGSRRLHLPNAKSLVLIYPEVVNKQIKVKFVTQRYSVSSEPAVVDSTK